jgi:uncharacterized phage-associated protein
MAIYDVHLIADWFLKRVDREAGDVITHLKLQKLLYFAQAWHLANKGESLFNDEIQAWAHGPVVRSIYDRFKGKSWDALDAVEAETKIPKRIANYMEKVFEMYGKYSAKHLEAMTHQHSPWIEARGNLEPEERCENIISKSSMRDFYGKKIRKTW